MEEKRTVKYDKDYKQYVIDKINEFNSNGKKTIVHFCDTYYPIIDGVIVVMDNYATRLSKFYNVVVVVPKHKNQVVINDKYLVIATGSMFFKFVNYDLAFPSTDGFVKKCLKLLRIDLIHSHSPFNMGKFAARIAKKKDVPLVMTMHSQYKKDFEKYAKSKMIVNMLLSSIVKVFSKSTEVWTMHNLVSDALKSYGYKGSFHYIPNATEFVPPKDIEGLKAEFNKQHGLSPDLPVFLFLGRIVQQKNIIFIVDALKILDQNGMDFQMYFVGDGPDLKMLKEHIEKLGLSEKIELAGRIDDRGIQAGYYSRADLFLFPSAYDTSSIVQVEAATHKTPGVYLEGTATAKTITDLRNGYLSKNSPEDFAACITRALSDKKQLAEISQNAFDDLYISWDTVVEKVKARYEYLIAKANEKTNK